MNLNLYWCKPGTCTFTEVSPSILYNRHLPPQVFGRSQTPKQFRAFCATFFRHHNVSPFFSYKRKNNLLFLEPLVFWTFIIELFGVKTAITKVYLSS